MAEDNVVSQETPATEQAPVAAPEVESPIASDPEAPAIVKESVVDLAEPTELAAVAPVVEEPAPAHAVDPSFVETPEGVEAFSSKNTDNHDSRGSFQGDQPEFGPRGTGVPADAFAPDNRAPIDKHFDEEGKATTSKNTVTDNVDSRGEDQGEQPHFGPRGFGVKSSPETFRH